MKRTKLFIAYLDGKFHKNQYLHLILSRKSKLYSFYYTSHDTFTFNVQNRFINKKVRRILVCRLRYFAAVVTKCRYIVVGLQ